MAARKNDKKFFHYKYDIKVPRGTSCGCASAHTARAALYRSEYISTKKKQGHSGSVYVVKFSKCGRLLASGSLDKSIRVCNLEHMRAEVVHTGVHGRRGRRTRARACGKLRMRGMRVGIRIGHCVDMCMDMCVWT